ncbi:MAG: lamin tail domain-containing protein [Anaerolineae bacterium]|nr:lamin tail domain-containing protein [Anaerolineae bacterium]
MNRRSLLGFVVLNVIVTFATVFGLISLWTRLSPPPTPKAVPPLVVVVTATLDPNATQSVMVVTTTPGGGASADSIAGAGNTPGPATAASGLGVPTLDPALLPTLGTPNPASRNGTDTGDASAAPTATGTQLDQNGCPTYTIKKGDILGNVAGTFGVTVADIMKANNLTEADLVKLQIGQVITIPVNGCGLATDTPTATPTKFVVPTLPPTATLAPTASNAQIEVVQVINAGDITAEAVEIRNISGGVIQMQGWTMTDSQGRTFTFPDYRMFPGGRVTINTRSGTNTPIVLYWGQSRAVWGEAGQQITISDSKGSIQTTYTVSGDSPSTPDPAQPVPTGTRVL